MNIYEQFGRQAEELATTREQLAREHAEHVRTVELLKKVCTGEVVPQRVTITGEIWNVAPATLCPETPRAETPPAAHAAVDGRDLELVEEVAVEADEHGECRGILRMRPREETVASYDGPAA